MALCEVTYPLGCQVARCYSPMLWLALRSNRLSAWPPARQSLATASALDVDCAPDVLAKRIAFLVTQDSAGQVTPAMKKPAFAGVAVFWAVLTTMAVKTLVLPGPVLALTLTMLPGSRIVACRYVTNFDLWQILKIFIFLQPVSSAQATWLKFVC
eukprot:CAMPEP_0115214458 /NCGR_PEP_ID=MMETSP0270-20121206/24316_1 /TAXON_ID=71861 /ORGANISM="Scrippsiella trochoidea, Strain CCMP3099" /LENGTH=154 /DNA_ID=CAMNT_0002628231 /DNA_START=44 /DNA_END=509 /DNA_ORIENTATION=+